MVSHRLMRIGVSSLVLALCPWTSSAQSFGTQATWTSTMRDVLGLEVADLTPDGVGQALCAVGANVAGDVSYPDGFRRINTSGEAGFKLPGLEVVAYAFSNGSRLSSIRVLRNVASQTAAISSSASAIFPPGCRSRSVMDGSVWTQTVRAGVSLK